MRLYAPLTVTLENLVFPTRRGIGPNHGHCSRLARNRDIMKALYNYFEGTDEGGELGCPIPC